MKSTLTKQMLPNLINENISHYYTYMKKKHKKFEQNMQSVQYSTGNHEV